ncbi:uncharacterized protein FTOL_00080 [Fusarium torulosum]|uniref:Uncharacterized protein n=1 Tax=Fusarium torulosum TaxID=33205 RepID=A0AAE8SCA2_9HYPO|nr:uncharacterized protein FTOL_00080 [Fusarium torulosum]
MGVGGLKALGMEKTAIILKLIESTEGDDEEEELYVTIERVGSKFCGRGTPSVPYSQVAVVSTEGLSVPHRSPRLRHIFSVLPGLSTRSSAAEVPHACCTEHIAKEL